MVSVETRQFIEQHVNDDPALLRLKAKGAEGVDLPIAAEQIAIRQQLKEKLPDWAGNFDLVFPSRLSAEQCSSEQTARYKQQFVSGGSLMDLTGGLGVDFFYLSQKAKNAVYIDRKGENCTISRHNFAHLGVENAEVIQGDSIAILSAWKHPIDFIYIDPSRRSDHNRRIYALHDCEPDVVKHKDLFLQKARQVLIKVSPMADVKSLLALFPEAKEVHIVSVRNECKEVLLLLDKDRANAAPVIYCVNLAPEKTESFTFSFPEEEQAAAGYGAVAAYLYEPNAAILKGGAFKSVAVRYGVEKLSPHSHLYASDGLISEFPGRIFEVEKVILFDKKGKIELSSRFSQANISVRNFPVSVAEIRRQTGIKEGGEAYLFATTLKDNKIVVIQTRKVCFAG